VYDQPKALVKVPFDPWFPFPAAPPVRKEAADESESSEGEEDLDRPALEEELQHRPFQVLCTALHNCIVHSASLHIAY
jgi:hypothetical protein